MQREFEDTRIRPDIKSLCIGSVYDKLQYLSKQEGTSASGWIRRKVIAEFKKEKKRELDSVGSK